MPEMHGSFQQITHTVDVCVVGGGMAGLCAAIAAARRGMKTVLMQDRPVLGGNASSEIRMWICGAHGKNTKETGVLEEIQLDNQLINSSGNYSIWDAVLWNAATRQPNLTLLMNCACCSGETEPVAGDKSLKRLTSIRGWQLTSQTWHQVGAKVFIDCSGDSVLAPISGAETRWGREAREEFGEDIEPSVADRKTMGNTLLVQLRRTDEVVPFTPPPFAHVFEKPEDLQHRINGVQAHNFWWIELGGLLDTIHDAERIHDDLMPVAWGVWDYIKNRSPAREDAAKWALEWIGSLPGKRENRRYVGGHIMTQNDVRAATTPDYFPDAIAYGGWSMDDHHPAGILYPGKPTIFHPAPSPYNIPYRSLYSRNVTNLMMAGRNISVTHAALSSTRVMATCAILGQAAGTGAAIAIQRGITPAQVYPNHVAELQQTLMADDCWLPGRARPIDALALQSVCDAPVLLNGHDRPVGEDSNAQMAELNQPITFTWKSRVNVGALRAVFDSNLAHEKRMPCSYPQKYAANSLPGSLVQGFRIEARRSDGTWQTVLKDENNHQRFRQIPLNLQTDALRFVPTSTWGGTTTARLFALEPVTTISATLPPPRERATWSSVVAKVKPVDLAPPECEGPAKERRGIGA
jgi:hypothetical protein